MKASRSSPLVRALANELMARRGELAEALARPLAEELIRRGHGATLPGVMDVPAPEKGVTTCAESNGSQTLNDTDEGFDSKWESELRRQAATASIRRKRRSANGRRPSTR